MARYIDADEFVKRVIQYPRQSTKTIGLALADTPTADVQEVKHGNWVGIDDDPCETFECDRCGFVLDDWIQGALYNFCPNCGADMREEGSTE